MRITEDTAERLTIQIDESRFAWGLIGVSLLCTVWIGVILATGRFNQNTERFWGLTCGALMFLFGGMAIFERSSFVFDKRSRELSWSRLYMFRKKSGRVPFDLIKDVVSRTLAPRVNPSRRLVLVLKEGELPLSIAYAPSVTELHDEVRTKILHAMR